MKNYFEDLADFVGKQITGPEIFTLSFDGEESDFIRMNHGKIRQAGHVSQAEVQLKLINGKKQAAGITSLSFDKGEDQQRFKTLFATLREQLPVTPDDPHMLYAENVQSTEAIHKNGLPSAEDFVGHICEAATGTDLVGIHAQGGIYRGFANSFGQKNWYENYSFNLDYSLYLRADKAVKSSYAGTDYDPKQLAESIGSAKEQLTILDRAPQTVKPGKYRVYLSPSALLEVIELLGWGGFGIKSHKAKQSCLQKMVSENARLSPKVTMRENTAGGISPNFNSEGFIKPDSVSLIEKGVHKDYLISPRSAKEFGVETNGAGSGESWHSIEMDGGDILSADAAKEVGEGLYINNLWYLNFSDRSSCRMTGMTRFAGFWVEGGEYKAPINVMRFDESLFRMLGDNLVGLTKEQSLFPSAMTYGARSTASARLPGVLVKDFNLTL
jgi:predicted Zn-dependent protease